MITNKNIFAQNRDLVNNGIFNLVGSGAPISGPAASLGSGAGFAGLGSRYVNKLNGVVYTNEGSAASPYWTPYNLVNNPALLAWSSQFQDGAGNAIAATTATVTIPGSGIRIYGTGIEETDSGFVVAIAEDGPIGTLTASATSGKVAAMGVGITTSVPYQPDSHGPIVMDAVFAVGTALTARKVWFGFLGTAADALASPSTGSGTTITMVQNDMAGLLMDSGLTAATRLFAPHNKADEAASIATTATGVDTGVNMSAFGVYQRLRVEILANGTMKCYKDKVLLTTIAASLAVDEEITPTLCVTSLASATKELLIKQFAVWGNRSQS